MSMASSLIASVHSALHYLDTNSPDDRLLFKLKLGLRTLKGLLIIGTRKFPDAHFTTSFIHRRSLYLEIQDAMARIYHVVLDSRADDYDPYFEIAEENNIHYLGREVGIDAGTTGPLLTLDDVVAIADSVLANCRDFPSIVSDCILDGLEVKVVDGFEVQMQFLRNFLVFANHTGVQLHDLLILIQPIVINAAQVFIKGEKGAEFDTEWIEKVQSKYSTVNGMANQLQIYNTYTQALSISTTGSHYAGMDDDILMDFLGSLISLLWDVLRHSDSEHDQLVVLYASLRSCRTIIKQHSIKFDGKIREQVGVLIRDAGSLVCSIYQTGGEKDVGLISDLLQRFDVIEAEIQNYPSESSDFVFGDRSTNVNNCQASEKDLDKVENETQILSDQPLKSTSPQVVGFQDDEMTSILGRLTRGSNQLRIVPISGMAGIGKTTFALKLYNHRSIMYRFQARAWCTISQVLNKKKLLVQLLNQIHESDSYSQMTEDDLAISLRRKLKGKRYLILLDDVWTPDVWNSLQLLFPDDSTQSRIIFTSRHTHIAPHRLLDGKPHSLRLRKDHECLEILQMKLSSEEEWNPDIGMEIAKLCKGLPLMVVIVAGLLANVKQQGWKRILDHFSSGGVSREELCNSALELSFKHLPDDLKLCFLYIGAFPEDEKVSVRRLTQLWMAEGFVKKNGSKTSEDVGREYLENLTKRSLVMVAQSRSIGGVHSFQIHDVVHDFCVTKARQENSFHLLHGYDQLLDFNQPQCLQRLCIHSMPKHFKNSMLFCPQAHSLLFFSPKSDWHDPCFADISFIIQIFKLLKVLDLQQFDYVVKIPSEIELLTRLRYLSIQSHSDVVPFSIGNLFNLETLIAHFYTYGEAISFPDSLRNLQKLKYLEIQHDSGFSLPIEDLEMSSEMLELETLSGALFKSDGSMEKQLRKFPNIRRLKCTILPDDESTVDFIKIIVPDILNQLRSLSILGRGKLQCEFGSTERLTKVALTGFELSREEIAVIGELCNLEVLKFRDISFSGGTLEMEEGEFLKLRIFSLYDTSDSSAYLRKWTVSDEQLPCLQKLLLGYCKRLEEIPSICLESSPTLEEIHVFECCSTLESLIRDIEAVHEDFGNFIKVSIQSEDLEE